MKHPGSRKYLLMSAALIFVFVTFLSIVQVSVQGEDDKGGVHGERDDREYLEIRLSKERYQVGEDICFNVTSHFDEAITEPLPSILNDDGECIDAGVRADVHPYPQLYPGQTAEYNWDPWNYFYGSDMPPGCYFVVFEHDGQEYTGEFWIDEPAIFDPAESDDISDGRVLDYPFIEGPYS